MQVIWLNFNAGRAWEGLRKKGVSRWNLKYKLLEKWFGFERTKKTNFLIDFGFVICYISSVFNQGARFLPLRLGNGRYSSVGRASHL